MKEAQNHVNNEMQEASKLDTVWLLPKKGRC